MTITNVFPVLMWSSPPVTPEAAAKRISECSGGVLDAPMTKLTGALFLSYEQLEKALFECKWNAKESFIMKSGPIKTMKITAKNMNTETTYQMVATEYPHCLLIHNVKLIVAPNEKEEDVKTFNETLLEDGLL